MKEVDDKWSLFKGKVARVVDEWNVEWRSWWGGRVKRWCLGGIGRDIFVVVDRVED